MDLYNPKKCDSYRFTAIKRDGHFTKVLLQDGKVTVFTRNDKDITDKVRYAQWFKDLEIIKEPYSREFHGELWLPGGVSTDVPHAYCTQNPRLQFHVFSAKHLPVGASLDEVEDDAMHCHLSTIPFWDFSERGITTEVFEKWKDVEGFVYSNGNMLDQVKEKPMRSVDLIIRGYQPGEGKYHGLVGALRVGTYDGEELATCSGFTDGFRRELTNNFHNYLGRVCEVKYQKVGAGGRLRHPVFLGMRDDKNPIECTIDQVR